jgi:hypothetical protein
MRYRATESGLVLAEREPVRPVAAPALWIPRDGSLWDLPPLQDPYGKLPKAEAYGVAGACGAVLSTMGQGASPVGIFGARCKLWCRADAGVLLGTNPFGTGATIQAVTLTGQPAAPVDFFLEITSTGALGAFTYRYGAAGSGGAMIETGLVGAATHNCIGAMAGVTIGFPAGTYTNLDNYVGVINTWTDLSGFGNDITSPSAATGAQYRLANYGGRPSLNLRGATTYMTCSSFVAASGNDTPFTIFMALRLNAVAADKVIFGCGSTTSNNPLCDFQLRSATPDYGFSKRDDAGTTKTISGGSADIIKHNLVLANDGATQTLYQDGALVTLTSSGDLNVGTTTCDRMTIGGRLQAALTLSMPMDIAEIWGIAGTCSAIELNAANSYYAQRYP